MAPSLPPKLADLAPATRIVPTPPREGDDPLLVALSAAVALRQSQLETQARVTELERRVSSLGDLDNSYVSVAGWFNLNHGTVTEQDASTIGRLATTICNERGIRVGKVKSPRWGRVNTYPEDVIAEAVVWFKERPTR